MLNDPRTKSSVDHATCTITFRRNLAAPREEVFDAWTKPEHLTQWWDPTGTPLSECAVDLRPGGRFRFVNRDGAHAPPFEGVYRTIERPAELVFDALGALGTVRLVAAGGGTDLTVTIRCASQEHLAQFLKLGVDAGTNQTLDNLVAYLEKARR